MKFVIICKPYNKDDESYQEAYLLPFMFDSKQEAFDFLNETAVPALLDRYCADEVNTTTDNSSVHVDLKEHFFTYSIESVISWNDSIEPGIGWNEDCRND